MAFIPKAHEIYKHFKGNLYQIVAVAEHSETGEQLVIYQAMYGDFKIYARPLEMFTGMVDKAKYPEADQEYRFELQGPDAARQKEETDYVLPVGKLVVTPEEEPVPAEPAVLKEEVYTEEELTLDPMVLEFLDADSCEDRLNILSALHHKITDEMITTMAIACDIEVGEGDIEKRYDELRTCLITIGKFETNRR